MNKVKVFLLVCFVGLVVAAAGVVAVTSQRMPECFLFKSVLVKIAVIEHYGNGASDLLYLQFINGRIIDWRGSISELQLGRTYEVWKHGDSYRLVAGSYDSGTWRSF